jgi:thymidylate synthase
MTSPQPLPPTSTAPALAFDSLFDYPEDRFRIISPRGDVGILTLWSKLDRVVPRLEAIAPQALDPQGRVAVLSQFYGGGFQQLLCNLLHNPQIRHLIAIGQDLADQGLRVCEELAAALTSGLEPVDVLGVPSLRVIGEHRTFPAFDGFDIAPLLGRVSVHRLTGRLADPRLADELPRLLAELPVHPAPSRRGPRIMPPTAEQLPRTTRRPGARTAQQVVGERPLQVWEDLVVRTMRFGEPVQLRKGPRIELLGAKAVILDPAEDSPAALGAAGFSPERFGAYQRAILDPQLPEGVSYTYGNRLRGYFSGGAADGGAGSGNSGAEVQRDGAPFDTLDAVVDRLAADPQSRAAYVSLWDTPVDLGSGRGGRPCLVSIAFRADGDALTLTGTFRSHNLLTAWLENVHGLIAIQRHVAERVGRQRGAITVFSHSLTIDPSSDRFALAQRLEEQWTADLAHDWETGKRAMRNDPNGYFQVTTDAEAGEIVAQYFTPAGALVDEYRAADAEHLAKRIAGAGAVSLVPHALWLGTELARAEARLRREPRG